MKPIAGALLAVVALAVERRVPPMVRLSPHSHKWTNVPVWARRTNRCNRKPREAALLGACLVATALFALAGLAELVRDVRGEVDPLDVLGRA